jgi:FMN phosphatase YigB (HAD superfamily)
MTFRGVIFDLFHTLTAAESEWSDLPWTSDALGIDRRVWNDALTVHSRWRLTGEVRDGLEIVRRLARDIDPAIPEEIVVRAAAFRQERFHRALVNIPPANLRVISELRDRGLSLALCSNADASEVAAWPSSPLCGLFDAEIFSCQVGAVKPEAVMYDLCLNQLGLAPANASLSAMVDRMSWSAPVRQGFTRCSSPVLWKSCGPSACPRYCR